MKTWGFRGKYYYLIDKGGTKDSSGENISKLPKSSGWDDKEPYDGLFSIQGDN